MLKLRGKTRKGKNRVKEHGEFWEILEEKHADCCNGIGWLIIPKNGDENAIRWINKTNDPDFEVEVVE